jgi:hypothetical protein
VRLANFVLGMTVVGLLTSVFGWVAFGSGPRRFTSTLWLPFMTRHWVSGEMSGRIVFGAFTVLMVFMFVACTIVGVQRLLRARQ